MSFIHTYKQGSGRTLLLLHGTGGNEKSLLQFGAAIDPSASLLGVRGKSLDEGYPRFFRRFGEGVFDPQDIRMRVEELRDWLVEAKATYGWDELIALGYSNGANVAHALMLLHPEILSAGIFWRPQVVIEPETPQDLSGVPVLMTSGTHDPIVPLPEAQALQSLLSRSGASVEHLVFETDHSLTRDDIESAKTWLAGPI